VSQFFNVHHNTHTELPGIEPEPSRLEVGKSPAEPWHGLKGYNDVFHMWKFSPYRTVNTLRLGYKDQ